MMGAKAPDCVPDSTTSDVDLVNPAEMSQYERHQPQGVDVVKSHEKLCAYAAAVQAGYASLVYAPCTLEEVLVRQSELADLESRGATIVYARQLQQLDREIRQLQPDIVAPVKYQNTAPMMDSDHHHRQMG